MYVTVMLLESKRKLQKNPNGAFYTTLDKYWITFNNLHKGAKLTHLAGSSIVVVISPDSPIMKDAKTFQRFKEEVQSW